MRYTKQPKHPSQYTPASPADSPPDALKMQLGPPPEDSEGPHTPEARAKHATLKCPGGRDREEASSEHTGRTKCRAGPPQKNWSWFTPRRHRGFTHTRGLSQVCYPEVHWWKGPGRSIKRRQCRAGPPTKNWSWVTPGRHQGSTRTRSRSQARNPQAGPNLKSL